MKSSINLKDLRHLSVEESVNIYGGNTQQGSIFFPIAVANELGSRAAPYLIDLYLKYSMFLNF